VRRRRKKKKKKKKKKVVSVTYIICRIVNTKFKTAQEDVLNALFMDLNRNKNDVYINTTLYNIVHKQ